MKHRTLEEKILLAISAAATLILFPFLVTSIISQDYAHIVVDFIAVGGIFCIFIGVWFTRKTHFFSGVFAVLAHVNILVGIYIKGAGLMYWIFPIIIASFYLLPSIVASILNLLLVGIACYITFDQFDDFSLPRIVAAFVVTNIFALTFSMFMQNKNRQLLEKDKINQRRNKILELIAGSSELSVTLSAIADAIEQEFPNSRCSILLVDKTGSRLEIGAAPTMPNSYHEALQGLKIDQNLGASGAAVYTGKRVVVSDIMSHPNWDTWRALVQQAHLVACWSEPIIDYHGHVLGTISIYHSTRSTPKNSDFKLMEQFANLARIAIERKQADDTIWHQANYDNLTSLPNRHLLYEHLESAIANSQRDHQQIAIAMLDLDKFKQVNDSLGHGAGDRVLVECAKRIKQCLRKNDIVARLGGDEFIIVFVGITKPEDIANVGEKLINVLSKPYIIQQQEIFCTASIGVAFYPHDAQNISALLKNADKAMYKAKTQGRNKVYFFSEDMSTKS